MVALPHLDPVLELASGQLVSARVRNHFARGNELLLAGDAEGALGEYDAALRLRPELEAALRNRAAVLSRLERYNEALAAINQYLALRSEDADAEALHREVLDKVLRGLAEEGFMRGKGGKPKGTKRPVRLKPGPPISDYIIEERERLRS